MAPARSSGWTGHSAQPQTGVGLLFEWCCFGWVCSPSTTVINYPPGPQKAVSTRWWLRGRINQRADGHPDTDAEIIMVSHIASSYNSIDTIESKRNLGSAYSTISNHFTLVDSVQALSFRLPKS
ncbi:hypothetical protein MJO28_016336 [Puccinia striiformis f. sp. tritici]|uniref:Uncharacterized protein n=1 Tax=Puccinia striiformis f. sp. tritici TaxID=168172 RepID=A0ACC0DMS3_9BASI|nr:hypothetical protein MJO28_016336 [Puccinia striiformis f. sp. tritici]